MRGAVLIPDEGMRELTRQRLLDFREPLPLDLLAQLQGMPPVQGGLEIFPDEGLDHILNKVPMATVAIQTTYYLGLFTSQTASTVPARTVTLVSQSGITEVANAGAYSRVAVANTDWGAISTSGSGRRTTSAQKSFAESTGSWSSVNGFFLATVTTHAAGVAIFYANFDDGQAVNVNSAGYTPAHHAVLPGGRLGRARLQQKATRALPRGRSRARRVSRWPARAPSEFSRSERRWLCGRVWWPAREVSHGPVFTTPTRRWAPSRPGGARAPACGVVRSRAYDPAMAERELVEEKVPWGHKPGKQNWVERYDALKPKGTNWIRRAAEHMHGKGMETGHAIASAVNAAKKMCATGDTNLPGKQSVNPGSRAQACEAVRIWEAAKAKARAARVSEAELRIENELSREERFVLSFDQARALRAQDEFPSGLVQGLVLLSEEEDQAKALAESVATVRRWANGLNDEADRVPQALVRQALEALVSWDIARLRAQSKLIEEGTGRRDRRFTDSEFIEALKSRGELPQL